MHTLQEVLGAKSNGKLARELYEAIPSGKPIELKPPPEKVEREGRDFRDALEVKRAYELGELELHARIRLNGSDTTVGRVIFNEILPEEIKVNEPVDKNGLRRLAEEICAKMGREAAVEFLNRVDDLGFRFATLFGASLSITTFKTISAKDDDLNLLYLMLASKARGTWRGSSARWGRQS